MITIPLGRSSLQASRIAYGCWRVGGAWEGAEITPERTARGKQAIITAYELGITLFDHADIYSEGKGEEIFGQVLKEVSGMRESILIASKCGIRKGDTATHAPYRYDFSREYIIESCEGSLRRLGVETIDLYQLHRSDYLGDPEEVASAFTSLKESGKVKEFGLSNTRPSFFACLQKYCPMPLLVNQVEINLLKLDTFNDGTLDQCLTEKITPLAWSPLAAGRLVSANSLDLHDPNHGKRLKLRETMDLIARHYGVSRTVVAISWLLKHPANIIPILGSTDPEKIKDSIISLSLELSREDWYRLMEAAMGHRLP